MSLQLKKLLEKQSDSGPVVIYQDQTKAYYAGKPDETFPTGAFRSLAAAKSWADKHFPGGSWS